MPGELGSFLIDEPLLGLTIAAILFVVLGMMLLPGRARLGTGLRNLGYFGLTAALLLTIAEATRRSTRSDAAILLSEARETTVTGGETRIPMRADGHFWVDASVNGKIEEFLVDTGATFTGLSQATANAAGVSPDPQRMAKELDTANGPIVAKVGTIAELRVGGVVVHGLETIISPRNDSDTNVIGMNLMNQLASWRVEDETLILVPRTESVRIFLVPRAESVN
jgi:aspartyl protease family protein